MPVFQRDGQSVLFVHIPKAGGSSIERMFAKAGWRTHLRDPRLGPAAVNHLRRCSPQHMHASLLDATLRLDRFDVIFAITREPVSRFRSEYAYAQRARELDLSGRAVEEWARSMFARYAVDPFVLDNHLRPQHEFILPGTRSYRLEDGLDNAVHDLNSVLVAPLEGSVPRALERKSEVGVSSSEVTITATLRAALHEFYARDFTMFGYEVAASR